MIFGKRYKHAAPVLDAFSSACQRFCLSTVMSSAPDADSWSRRFAEWLYAHRRGLLAIGLLGAVLAVGPTMGIEANNTLRQYVVESDPALASYQQFQNTYGNDETVLIGLRRSEGLLTPDGLRVLRTATERIDAIEEIVEVQSLTTQVRLQPTLTGMRTRPLVPSGSLSVDRAAALRRHVRRDSAFSRLVSADGKMAAIIARMPPAEQLDGRRGAILDSIRHRLRPLNASVHLAGMGVILEALNEATTQDSALVLLASLVGILVLLAVFFRRIGPVVVTVGSVSVAALWVMGLYGAMGKSMNTVTLVIPTLIMVVGTADCVHLLVHAAHRSDALSRREHTIRTVSYLFFPCAVTSLTTAVGFGVLATSAIPIVQDLGLFSALGVLGAFAASLIGGANAVPYGWSRPHRPDDNALDALLDGTVRTGLNRWRMVLAGGAVAAGLAVFGITQLTVNTNSIGYLYPDHPVREDSRLIESKLGPYAPLEFVVRTDSTMLRPVLLGAVRRWARRVEATGAVGWHRSAADELYRLRAEVGREGGQASSQIRGLLALGRSHSRRLDELADHPAQLRVTFGIPIQSAQGLRATIDTVRAQADGVLPADVTVEATGYLPLYVRVTRLIVDAQLHSFGWALLVIPALIGLLFGGLWAVGWSLVPNLLPVGLTLGAMGALGIPLDIVTVTIAVIVFGLVVDDTVHLLHRYADARHTQAPEQALATAARRAGRMMAITTAVLAGGFLVLALAQNRSVVWFGTLIAGALGAALVVDLLLMPALLAGGRWAKDRMRQGSEKNEDAEAR